MKDEGKRITPRRNGAGDRRKVESLLCASGPWREIFPVVFFCYGAMFAVIANGGDEVHPPAPEVTATSWPLGRGNVLACGVAKTTLPDKPELLWKIPIEKGAFDGTPVIAEGVVYLGDMDGT